MNFTMIASLVIFAWAVINYVWGKLSMALTAMIALAAFVLTGALDPDAALSCFGNNNAIMIMSMFVVAAGLQRTQFITNVASSVNKIAKGSMTKVLVGYVLIAVILSQFIQSPLIVFSIMAPMMTGTCREMGISPSKVMFPLGVAAISTCSAFPLGTGATVAAELNGYLVASGYDAYTVGLTDPMKARLPVVIVCILYCVFVAPRFAPDKAQEQSEDPAGGRKGEEKPPLKPFQERAGYIIFILATLGLIFNEQLNQVVTAPSWMVCFVGAILMVLLGVLKGPEALKALNLRMYMMFAGTLAMSNALSASGAGEALGNAIAGVANSIGNQYLIALLFFGVPFVLTQLMSNRAVMMIFIPVAIQACKSMGANPVGVIIMVQAACLTAFATPMATTAVPMIMAEGNYSFNDTLKQSIVPCVLFCAVSVIWTMTVYPMF